MSQAINSLKSICILRLSSIGDITHMIPIIKTIQTYSTKTNITWIIGKTEYMLVKNLSNINFIVINKNSLFSTLSTLLFIYRNYRFDSLLHMQVSLRSNLISLFIKAKRKIGFDKYNSKNIHRLFINERIDSSPRLHVMETFFKFPSKLGIKKRCYDKDLNIKYIENRLLLNKKYIVFNPFTSSRKFNYREWNINNYRLIIKYLSDNYNIDSVMVGGNSKYELIQSELLDSEKRLYNLVGKTNLQELYNILKMCKLYIGPDSGTLHIASTLNKPVIGLYATSNPHRTGPIGNMQHTINKYPDALRKYSNTEIKSSKWGARVRNKNAMNLIGVEEVIINIDRILKL
tara:strand:+ start:756 stop:1790 length:1035 start_codon:yes stop_codon:yes gene_type:complete